MRIKEVSARKAIVTHATARVPKSDASDPAENAPTGMKL